MKQLFIVNEGLMQLYPLRSFYEQAKIEKRFFLFSTVKMADVINCAMIDSTVTSFLPKENKIVLKNGRQIKYNTLVVGTGISKDFDRIENLRTELADQESNVYGNYDPPTLKQTDCQGMMASYNNNHNGDYIFHIPKRPFHGEVENYNFFLTDAVFKWQKKIAHQSPL